MLDALGFINEGLDHIGKSTYAVCVYDAISPSIMVECHYFTADQLKEAIAKAESCKSRMRVVELHKKVNDTFFDPASVSEAKKDAVSIKMLKPQQNTDKLTQLDKGKGGKGSAKGGKVADQKVEKPKEMKHGAGDTSKLEPQKKGKNEGVVPPSDESHDTEDAVKKLTEEEAPADKAAPVESAPQDSGSFEVTISIDGVIYDTVPATSEEEAVDIAKEQLSDFVGKGEQDVDIFVNRGQGYEEDDPDSFIWRAKIMKFNKGFAGWADTTPPMSKTSEAPVEENKECKDEEKKEDKKEEEKKEDKKE